MRLDAIVAGGVAASYAATALWAGLSDAFAPGVREAVSVKDAGLAALAAAWAVAEWRRPAARSRLGGPVAGLVLLDALVALGAGAGPWRTTFMPEAGAAASIAVGAGLVAISAGLLAFVRRPVTPGS
jgi:hypothetical protein